MTGGGCRCVGRAGTAHWHCCLWDLVQNWGRRGWRAGGAGGAGGRWGADQPVHPKRESAADRKPIAAAQPPATLESNRRAPNPIAP